MLHELELIDWIRSIPQTAHPELPLTIGDDAAWIKLQSPDGLVTTVDMLMDGTDFRLHEVTPERIGHKALAVNLSDLAAMAATPFAALVSAALPRQLDMNLVQSIYRGIFDLGARFDVRIIGGDTNIWDGPLVISITAFGRVGSRGVVTRGGAHADDAILVTGELGGSILGKHLDFTPRVVEAKQLHEQYTLTAMIDLSDGLAKDLRHICHASGLGAELWPTAVPIAAAANQSNDQQTALYHALTDGEDFELCFTMTQVEADLLLRRGQVNQVPVRQIGRMVQKPGLWWAENPGGKQVAMEWTGYEHR